MNKHTIFSVIAAAALSLAASIVTHAQEASEMFQLPTPTESGFAEVNDVKVWYQTYGEGDPLILLHGGLGTVEMFGPNIALLAESRKVIGVDLQGHGGTGPLGREMTFEAMATDIAELIRALGYEKADVFGYSLGGATAMRLAIDHPEVVDHLVLLSAAYAFDNWHTYNFEGMRSINADPVATAESLIGSPMHQAYIAKAPGGADSWVDAVKEIATLVGVDYDFSAEIPSIKAPTAFAMSMRHSIAGIKAHTLVIVADWDAVRISAATKLFEMLGGGAQDANWDRSGMGRNHFAVIPNATHYDIINTTAASELAIPFLDN